MEEGSPMPQALGGYSFPFEKGKLVHEKSLGTDIKRPPTRRHHHHFHDRKGHRHRRRRR